jgi:hypothetical protein
VQRAESEDHAESVRIGGRCSTWPKPLLLRIERAFISRGVCVGARHMPAEKLRFHLPEGAGRHNRLETHEQIGRRFSRCHSRAPTATLLSVLVLVPWWSSKENICVGFRRCPCSLGEKAFAVHWSGQPKEKPRMERDFAAPM